MEADTDRDGKINFEEFMKMVENTDVSMSMTLGKPFKSPIFGGPADHPHRSNLIDTPCEAHVPHSLGLHTDGFSLLTSFNWQ